MKRRIAVFGATGTIGANTLALARQFPERLEVTALTGGRNTALLKELIREFHPRVVVTARSEDAALLAKEFPGTECLHGDAGLKECARWDGFDWACQGISGFAALASTFELVRSRKSIALANKETLVVAGQLLRDELENSGTTCIPVDSEHNALFQLLEGKDLSTVRTLVLTASGGPFWNQKDLDLSAVTPAMAVKHPNWKMGAKISVDSATLMNKGLELVEAHALFGFAMDKLEVWIHPESVVHGAVWFDDGTCQAQLSKPDMKASIGFALAYPDRLPGSVEKLDIAKLGALRFAEPDTARFPCLDLPRQALAASQSHLIALNAANEVAVAGFLENRLKFTDIPKVLRRMLDAHSSLVVKALADVFEIDALARVKTHEIIAKIT